MDTNDMDDFVKDMEEDILDDEQLNDMIPETPQPPKKNIYQETIRKPIQTNQQQRRNQPRQEPRQEPRMKNQQPQYNEQQYQQQMMQQQMMQPQMMQPQLNQHMGQTNNSSKMDNVKKMMNFGALKLPIIVFVLYMLLTLPIISDMIGNYIPILKPGIVGTLVKGVILSIIVLILNKLIKS
jgi:hypothetical protein